MWSGREMFLTVNSRWEVVDPGKGLSFYSLAWYLVRKNKKVLLRNYLASVSPIPLSENLGWEKHRGANYNECQRGIWPTGGGKGAAWIYRNLPRVVENNVTTPGPGPMVIIFKSNETINYGRNSWLFRISILMWAKPEARSLVNAVLLGSLMSSFRCKLF